MSKVSSGNTTSAVTAGSATTTASAGLSIAQYVAEYQQSVDKLTESTKEERSGILFEIDKVNAELEALEKRRRDLQLEIERIDATHRVGMTTSAERLAAILMSALAEQSVRVRQRISEYANGHTLALRKQAIFAAEPNLAKKYARYVKMAETLSEKLAEFEELDEYAKALLDTHKSLQEDVRELLEIDEAIRAIQAPASELRVDLFYIADGDGLLLIAPAYPDVITRHGAEMDVESLWLDSIFDAFRAIEKPITEFVAERIGPYVGARVRMPAGWSRFDDWHQLAEQVHLILNAHMRNDIRVFVTFVQVPEWTPSSIADAGGKHRHDSDEANVRDLAEGPIEAEATVEAAGEPTEEESEDSDEEGEVGEGWVNAWIRRSDLREWRRKAPDSTTSKWTPHARRVRTLLIRMVGRGAIGSNTTVPMSGSISAPISALLDGLPEAARTGLHTGIQQLLAGGVLTSQASGDAQLLSIASDRLEMVGDLINRDVTPEWEELLTGIPQVVH